MTTPRAGSPVVELPRLILASASPRRRSLLASLGLTPEVRPVDISEQPRAGEHPEALVARLAREKSRLLSAAEELVLGADTVVVIDGEILGKPADQHHARAMLDRLSGRDHQVLTGVHLLDASSGRHAEEIVSTRVRLAPMSRAEIDWYVGTEEPMDKAGAYAIQGLGALFVEAVRGSYTNVVGLPLPTVYALFRRLDYDLLDFRGPAPTGSGSSPSS